MKKINITISEKKIELNKEEFVRAFLSAINLIGDNKEKVFIYILNNSNNNNLFFDSQRSISKKLDISYPIVSSVFVTLQKHKILTKITNSQYLLSISVQKFSLVLKEER